MDSDLVKVQDIGSGGGGSYTIDEYNHTVRYNLTTTTAAGQEVLIMVNPSPLR